MCEGPVRKSPVKSALRRRQPPKSTYRAGERYAVHPRRRVGRPPKVGCRTLWPVCQSCKRQWGAGARACSAIGQIDGEWPETDALVGCGRWPLDIRFAEFDHFRALRAPGGGCPSLRAASGPRNQLLGTARPGRAAQQHSALGPIWAFLGHTSPRGVVIWRFSNWRLAQGMSWAG